MRRHSGIPQIASLLLSYHADPNAKREPDGSQFESTPLQCAARTGNLEMARLLINAGAEVNAKGNPGRTPLSFAVLSGRLDMIRFLIEKGAEVNTRDAEGASPLDYAAWQGSLDMAAMLLAHGACSTNPLLRPVRLRSTRLPTAGTRRWFNICFSFIRILKFSIGRDLAQ